MTIGGAQNIFPNANEPNVTYDWLDLASGSGYVQYDCYSSLDNSSIKRLLVESRDASDLRSVTYYITDGGVRKGVSLSSSSGTPGAPAAKVLDIDWDTTVFQLPRTIKGKAYFNWNMIAILNTTGGTWYFVLRLRKWDGSTETEIASVQTSSETWVSDSILPYNAIMEIPQTNFKKGDQLRFTLELWYAQDAGGATEVYIAGDPSDSETYTGRLTAGNTRIILAIPYKIES